MFPDSSLPSADDVLSSARGLFEAVETRSAARDLEKTMRAWLDRLEANRDAAGDALRRGRGQSAIAAISRPRLRCLEAGYLDVLQARRWKTRGE